MRRTVAALVALLLPAVAAAQPSPTFTNLRVNGAITGNPVFTGNPSFAAPPSFAAFSLTNRSGSVSAGGTAQSLMGSNLTRIGCSVQNQSAADLWVSEVGTAAATQPSHWIPPGSEWSCPFNSVSSAISVFGSITGQSFAAREWQ